MPATALALPGARRARTTWYRCCVSAYAPGTPTPSALNQGSHLVLRAKNLAPYTTLSIGASEVLDQVTALAGCQLVCVATIDSELLSGGDADFLAEVSNVKELRCALRYARKHGLPSVVIGKASNVLFQDDGYQGLVIVNRLTGWKLWRAGDATKTVPLASGHLSVHGSFPQARMGVIEAVMEESCNSFDVELEAGCPINQVAALTAQCNLSGLEFAIGIPGTVGGAVAMNAGAHGLDMSTITQHVTILNCDDLGMTCVKAEDLQWTYRKCVLSAEQKPGVCCITSVTVRLRRDSTAWDRASLWAQRRRLTQPVTEKSAGCIFRNPADGCSAGQLIDKAGLKGHTIGGAQACVHAHSGVTLELELQVF